MAEMYGSEKASDIIGSRIERFLPRNKDTETYLMHFIKSGYRVVNAETRERDKDGRDVYFINNLIGIVEDGCIKRAWGTQSDITARKALEKQKDEFIGVASHELRTPVTSIKAYAETLYDMLLDTGDSASAELAIKLDQQVDRLRNLIHDLLDATNLTEGGGVFRQESFDLGTLVEDTVDLLQRTTKTHIIEHELDALPPVVGDRDRIQQVLNNLVTNAIKYSPEANRVVIRTKSEDGKVTVSVQDFGIGMKENVQGMVFDRFFRAPDPKVSTYPGLGLGLYIAAEIVKRHGGEMWVESKRGKGSTFYFTLPF
jgi:signal transduction histidine kinase